MNIETMSRGRVLGLHAAAKRLRIPERTLRYQAGRGKIPGAFKQGKLWKFAAPALAALPKRGAMAAALLFALLAGSQAQMTRPQSRKEAAGFTLRDDSGKNIQLAALKGKVVLLNFWATWCHGCVQEMPWIVEYADRYRSGGLAVLGVAMDEEGWEKVKPFLERKKLNYPVVVGTEAVAQAYGGVEDLPSTFLIDREGRVAAAYKGMIDREKCEADIRALLAEGSPGGRKNLP